MAVETANSFAVDWLLRRGKSVSAVGALAADILQEVYGGIYHIEGVEKISFAGSYVEVPIHGSLSTYDWNLLTRLVVLAHDRCVRIEVSAKLVKGSYEGDEYESPELVLLFHKRERGGDWYHGHPTMEEAIKTIRERGGRPEPHHYEPEKSESTR